MRVQQAAYSRERIGVGRSGGTLQVGGSQCLRMAHGNDQVGCYAFQCQSLVPAPANPRMVGSHNWFGGLQGTWTSGVSHTFGFAAWNFIGWSQDSSAFLSRADQGKLTYFYIIPACL